MWITFITTTTFLKLYLIENDTRGVICNYTPGLKQELKVRCAPYSRLVNSIRRGRGFGRLSEKPGRDRVGPLYVRNAL